MNSARRVLRHLGFLLHVKVGANLQRFIPAHEHANLFRRLVLEKFNNLKAGETINYSECTFEIRKIPVLDEGFVVNEAMLDIASIIWWQRRLSRNTGCGSGYRIGLNPWVPNFFSLGPQLFSPETRI